METIWFCLVAVMLAAYVVLDGFDLGAGVIHLFAARNDTERRSLLACIGPVWDGNEVWLLAAGGTLYFAFPGLHAAGFGGFYLALMVVLWLLMLRGISIGFRSHLKSNLWRPFWDLVFCAASALLVVFYGAALGNVVRGVPLDHEGFFLPLWTNFLPGANPGIIDWYTVLIGIAALLVLTMHGALWISLKATDELRRRARGIASWMFWPVSAATIAISVVSFMIQPHLGERFSQTQLLWVFPLIAATGLFTVRITLNASVDLLAFLGSCVFIAGLLCSAAFGLYPVLLPSISSAGQSLTIGNVAASHYGLATGLRWWIPGFVLAVTYSFIAYRAFAGRVNSVLTER